MKRSDNNPEEIPANGEDSTQQDNGLQSFKRQRATDRAKFSKKCDKFKKSVSERNALQSLETQCSDVDS